MRPSLSLEKSTVPSSWLTSKDPSLGSTSSVSCTMTVGNASSSTSASWMNVSTPLLSNSTFTTVGGGASRPERQAIPRRPFVVLLSGGAARCRRLAWRDAPTVGSKSAFPPDRAYVATARAKRWSR
uniref:Uncharacterized protein n=1 Tax=Micromonas pusilla TaxID=38833 RepID=A0A7S0KWD0_MICPS